LKVTREEMPPRQAILSIEMEDDDLEVYLDRAYKKVVQQLRVPGFRKGKAPRGILERLVGRDVLLNEAMEFLVPEATAQAVREEAPEAFAEPDVEILGTEPVTLKAVVPLTPEVVPGDYRSLRIPKEPVVLDEAEVEAALQEFRRDGAPWEPVDRPLQMEDLAVLGLVGETNGAKLIDRNDAQYVVSDEPFLAEGFGQALVGMVQGETREFDLALGDDVPDPSMAGALCHFTATLKETKEKNLPELDDELAKGVGEGYDTLDALRDEVRKRQLAALERNSRRAYEEAIVDSLLRDAIVDLPPILIEREIDHMVADLRDGVQRQTGRRLSVEEYVSALQRTEEEVREELRPQSVVRLHRSFLLAHLADQEGIHIGDDDVQAEVAIISEEAGSRADEVREVLSRAENLESLARSLRPQRTIERISAIARGEASDAPADVTPSEPEAVEETDAAPIA
jgi:trigger factor